MVADPTVVLLPVRWYGAAFALSVLVGAAVNLGLHG
jgi:hypothetical protein